MLSRRVEASLRASLRRFPIVGLIGSRQSGKTTLARALASGRRSSVYLDLERPSDLARLADAELYLSELSNQLVVLDEVQRRPDLFPLLRSLVDAGKRPGRFLVLGSASPELGRQAAESLAGRIVYHELPPFTLDEIGRRSWRRLWWRGGYPPSFLAGDDATSIEWRESFLRTHLERDLPQLGIRVPATQLRRFWEMLAHLHGQPWNASAVAASLGTTAPTARHYLDLLTDTFVVRQLAPWFSNLGKRLVKAPKVYLRDSGLLHALLRIESLDALRAHPVAGPSWEGWVLEQVLAVVGRRAEPYFYRTHAGAEVDLVLTRAGKPVLACEVKLSLSPAPTRGLREALSDLEGVPCFIIYPGTESYSVAPGIKTLPLSRLGAIDAALKRVP
ncbi:MAG: ATP-binding protein [Candidatus Wallbacteria bacterium]|nr:ATP-binding protein [Candidatus Wallbacteria bacterium]